MTTMLKDDLSALLLFRRHPRTCRMIRVRLRSISAGHVRHAAEVYVRRKTDKARRAYWRRIIGSLAEHMARAGVGSDVIDHEIVVFRKAVEIELEHLWAARHRNAPDGAA